MDCRGRSSLRWPRTAPRGTDRPSLLSPGDRANRRDAPGNALRLTGLASLSESERAELPELVLDDAEHRAVIFGLFGVLPEHAAEFGLEDVYTAQTTWDETMADSAARWLNASGEGARIAILAGNAHCHESAIPRRLTRRTQLAATSSAIVLQSELDAPDFSAEGYDVLIVLEDTGSP
ncbi:MAG TPA: ChaN family lipoprotein [Polyangiaceae bacterium]|nr:ChaN family lipoprotein [Polyangiaceae bacterium]